MLVTSFDVSRNDPSALLNTITGVPLNQGCTLKLMAVCINDGEKRGGARS